MDIRADSAHRRWDRDRTYVVLHALQQLGPGPHKFRTIASRTPLGDSEVHRRLRQLREAQLCDRPRHGYWELRPDTAVPMTAPDLLHPSTTPLFDTARLLEAIHRRTRQVVLLHTYSPLSGERLCIAAAGTYDVRFRRDMALTTPAIGQLRQAPLDSDAPGRVMLASLVCQDTPLREDLRQIRSAQMALSNSPLPGWSLVSVAVRRLPGAPATPGAEPRLVGAVSVLAPDGAQGAPLVAYGRLLRSVVQAAVETSAVITKPRFAAVKAA